MVFTKTYGTVLGIKIKNFPEKVVLYHPFKINLIPDGYNSFAGTIKSRITFSNI